MHAQSYGLVDSSSSEESESLCSRYALGILSPRSYHRFNQKQDLLWSNSVSIHTCDKQIRLSLCPYLLFWINHDEPFHLQDLISNSHYCLSYNSYDVSSENVVLNHLIIPYLIFFFILVTCLFDIVLIWWGEFCLGHSWELKSTYSVYSWSSYKEY